MSQNFNKTNPEEIINVGDIIVLDLKTGLVTVSKANNLEDYIADNGLVVGVCNFSNNTFPIDGIIDCGTTNVPEINITLLNLGDSTTETEHIINGGNSTINPRTYIGVQSTGVATVTRDNRPLQIGDKVIMSIEPNKVTSSMFDEFDRRKLLYGRTLGKVIRIEENNKVQILLDIE